MKDESRLRKMLQWGLALIVMPVIVGYVFNYDLYVEALYIFAILGFIGVILLILSVRTVNEPSRKMKLRRWGWWLLGVPLLTVLVAAAFVILFVPN